MQMPIKTSLGMALAAILLVPAAHAGIVLNFFPATDFNANTTTMDAALGITGYTIDDFETTTLIPGLTVTLSGGVTSTTWTVLPNLFDQSVCGSLSVAAWDGTHAATNSITNLLNNCNNATGLASLTTFNYAPGTTSFGIALSNFQSTNPASPAFPITNHELFVNGTDLGTVESLAGANWSPGIVRNAYLRIDASGGSSITSVGFENLSNTAGTDFLAFDRLAVVAPVTTGAPEPGSGGLLLLGLGLIPAALRKFR
jgi:hypothetical protein